MMRSRALLIALLLVPAALAAQVDVPSLRWRSITTEHFRIHFEPGLEDWARNLAARMESVREAVAARVGYTPPQVIDIIVEDPLNVANGSAWPSLFTPAMRFWATPPQPSSTLSGIRGWGEVLAVHEYAHLAHLLRPSREPGARIVAFLSGVSVGPMLMVPSWVTEGYATLIEGELTGAGRPNNVSRPAILRQLALEGYLPSYGELDATGRFNGGAMRYLVGSAYLEWLQAQRGDSALPHLWRRATSRKPRKFPEAFVGVFGDAPEVLYGRFASQLTADAHAARRQLVEQGLAKGALVQHWTWNVGAPAVSPNGDRIAVRRSSPSGGSRVQVLALAPRPMSARDSARIAKRFARDPEDVRPIEPYPRPLRSLAALTPKAGASYDAPRWLRDGNRLLVTRAVPRADGRVRPDLFLWDLRDGSVRRVTRGAGILQADPLPDGREAAALSCGAGTCSLLIVDLHTGALRPLAAGALDRGFAGVRVSPDGRRVVTSRQRGASWDLVVVDIATGALSTVGPTDGAARHTATWADDSTIVAVSEASGVAVVERIAAQGARVEVIARSESAAGAPDVAPDGRVYWLDLHGRGFDLRVSDSAVALAPAAPLDRSLFPATRRVNARLARDFDSTAVAEPRPYGIGPLGVAFVPTTTSGPDGDAWTVGLNLGDPLARAGLYLAAGDGTAASWRGARAALSYRGLPVTLRLEGFTARQEVSAQRRFGGPAASGLDAEYQGLVGSASLVRFGVGGSTSLRVGGTSGRLESLASATAVDRRVAFGAIGIRRAFTPGSTTLITAELDVELSQGSTGDADWTRSTAEFALAGGPSTGARLGIRGEAGRVFSDAAAFPGYEGFAIGGSGSPYFDDQLLGQRVRYPALPIGALGGTRYAIFSAETTGPLRLHYDWLSAGTQWGSFTRVIGVEIGLDVNRVSVFRLPAFHARTGVSHVLNAPLANATVGYVSLTVNP